MNPAHDLIIIGCGPAGASAALAAAGEGLDVMVLERVDEVGSPVRCGEYVPAFILKDIPAVDGFVAQPVDGMEVSLPSGEVLSISSPGLMIERDRFDSVLAQAASEAGARIITSATVTATIDRTVHAAVNGERRSFRGRVIIGADGPRSVLSEAVGGGNGRFAAGVQERLLLTRKLERAFIYYDHRYVGGYAWLFPRGASANVGLALDRRHSKGLWGLYHDFRDRLLRDGFLASEKPLYRTGGMIPAGGLGDRIQWGQLLLAGDAAGAANPLTGAGIGPAVISGTLAGEFAAEAVKRDDMTILKGYREECAAAFPCRRLDTIKREVDSSWGTPRGDAAIAEYWRGFV